ncbi:MAG TPA: hypothetical protein VKR58_02010 [Aquella sp.]|nr:hypothetical protein [Aquella sp.]
MLSYRKLVLVIIFITGIIYSGNSFCEDNIQNSCEQIIKNPAYPMCDEQKLTNGKVTNGEVCYIDSDKIIPGQTAVGYQAAQGILHDISKEENEKKEGQINNELEEIINFQSPVLLLDESLIPADYIQNTGKLPIILLDAHHRTVALKRWQNSINQEHSSINQEHSYCRLIKIETIKPEMKAEIDEALKYRDKNRFWKTLNEKGYSNVENVDSYSLDFLKMTDSPMRSLFGINPDKDNMIADSNIYPNIMAKIPKTVNFREFVVSKKLLSLINKDDDGADEILNNDKIYSNKATIDNCVWKVNEEIKDDTNRRMGKKIDNPSYLTLEQAQKIRVDTASILKTIDMQQVATHWEKENWDDNSVRYKALKCYMGNLHLHNPALQNALTTLWHMDKEEILHQ